MKIKVCPICKGSGEDVHEAECSSCDGTGYMGGGMTPQPIKKQTQEY